MPQKVAGLLGGIGDDLDSDFAVARPVKLAEEECLPSAEGQPAILDHYGLADARQRAFHMRIGIAFGVLIVGVARCHAVEHDFDVARHRGIIAFVHEDARGGVRYIEIADALVAPGCGNNLLDLLGDVNQLRAARALHCNRVRADALRVFDGLVSGLVMFRGSLATKPLQVHRLRAAAPALARRQSLKT